jgi:hypothetical protein
MKITFTYLLFIIFLSSCQKESPKFTVPEEFNGPLTDFSQFYGNWKWLYSNSPSTIIPPFTGTSSIQIWKDSAKFDQNGLIYFYLTKSTLENNSIPFLHYFNRNGEYEFSSSMILFGGTDSLLFHTENALEGAEDDLVYLRN